MDPLSITASCVGILGVLAKTSTSITQFVRDVRDSRKELSETKQQMAELEMTLNLINDDHHREDGNFAQQMPDSITQQTKLVLGSCRGILTELDALIVKYNSERRRAKFEWARKGKGEVAALNRQLEAHTRTLHMSLEFSTLIWSRLATENTVFIRQDTRKIIADTGQLLDETGEIKIATTQLLEDMDTLKSQEALKTILEEIERIKILVSQRDLDGREGRQDIMRRYLDSLSEIGENELGVPASENDAVQDETICPTFQGMSLHDSLSSTEVLDEISNSQGVISRGSTPVPAPLTPELVPTPQQQRKARTYLNPDSPISILLVGQTQCGKSSFLNFLLKMAPEQRTPAPVGASSNVYYTKITQWVFEVPSSYYQLINKLTGEEFDISHIAGSFQAERDLSYKVSSSKYDVVLRNPEAPYIKLKIFDTPGFDDDFDMASLQPLIRRGFESLLNIGQLGRGNEYKEAVNEEAIDATVLIHSLHNPYSHSSQQMIRIFRDLLPHLREGMVVMNTHASLDSMQRMSAFRAGAGEVSRAALLKSRTEIFEKCMGFSAHQFFIDSVPNMKWIYERQISLNSTVEFLHYMLKRKSDIAGGIH